MRSRRSDRPARLRVSVRECGTHFTRIRNAPRRDPPHLDRHGDDRAQARHRPDHRGGAGRHRRRAQLVAEAPVWVVHQSDAVLAGMDAWNQGTHGRSGLIDKVKASHAGRNGRRGRGARVPARARAGEGIADVRQLDLPGPPLPRALDARARGLLPLPEPRRLDAEGARAPLEARPDEGGAEGRQARGAGRRLRIDRRAQVLPRELHPAFRASARAARRRRR